MQKFINWMEGLPKIVKIICCFWILDILWAVYRIFKSVKSGDAVKIILAVLWIIAAGTVGWILDIIWIALYDRVFWFKD